MDPTLLPISSEFSKSWYTSGGKSFTNFGKTDNANAYIRYGDEYLGLAASFQQFRQLLNLDPLLEEIKESLACAFTEGLVISNFFSHVLSDQNKFRMLKAKFDLKTLLFQPFTHLARMIAVLSVSFFFLRHRLFYIHGWVDCAWIRGVSVSSRGSWSN